MCIENHFYVYLKSSDALAGGDVSKGRFSFDLSSLGGGTDLSQYQDSTHCEVKVCNVITDITDTFLILAKLPMPNSLETSNLATQNNYNLKSSNIIGIVSSLALSEKNHFENQSVKIMNIFRGALEINITNQTGAVVNCTDKSWQMYLRVTFRDDQLDKVNDAVHQIKLKPFTSKLLSS